MGEEGTSCPVYSIRCGCVRISKQRCLVVVRKIKRMLSASHLFVRRSLCSVSSHIGLDALITMGSTRMQYAIALK